MTDENINLVLTNSLCCLGTKGKEVAKLLSIGDSCAESEVIKLKILHDYYNAIKCYNTTPIVTIEGTILSEIISITTLSSSELCLNNVSILNGEYTVFINDGGYVSTLVLGDGVKTIGELVIETLITLGYYISHTVEITSFQGITIYKYIFTLTCNVLAMAVGYLLLGVGGIEIQKGDCGTEILTSPENCLTQEEFDIIINRLMEACDICPCQLKS